MIRTRFLALATAAGVLLSAAAWAQQAYTTRTANVRAGPDTDFPVVAQLAPGTPVQVDGCLPDYLWCDVDFGAGRGWVHTQSLQSYYGSRVVPLYGYGATLGLPIVTFSLFNYWDRHYRDRPWYRDRPRWESRWGNYDRDRRWDGRRDNDNRWDGRRDNDNRWDGRRDNDRRGDGRRDNDRPRVENRPRPNVERPGVTQQQFQQQREQQIRQERSERPRQPGQPRVSGDDKDWTRERQGQ
jgi:uncharacterized protein YraI